VCKALGWVGVGVKPIRACLSIGVDADEHNRDCFSRAITQQQLCLNRLSPREILYLILTPQKATFNRTFRGVSRRCRSLKVRNKLDAGKSSLKLEKT